MPSVQIEHPVRDFDTNDAAAAFVTSMQGIWRRVEGTVMTNPRVRIVDCVGRHEY